MLYRKIWLIFSRTCFLFLGILLLIIAIPHKHPWNMSQVGVQADKGLVTIDFPVIKTSIQIHTWNVFIAAGIALFALVLLTPSGRRAALNCFRKIRPIPAILLAMSALIFTLKPTRNGMPIVLYLTFGSVGLLYALAGVYPLVIWLGRYRISGFVRRVVGNVSSFLYNVDIRYFLGVIFVLAFTATNLASYFIFEHIPHIQDSLDQVFHGKMFASGNLTVPSHEYKEFFDFTHMINDGKWYSEYPPGHSFLMMLGAFLSMPWIINPLMGSLSIITFYFIGKEIYDERTGRIAALLGLFSPFIIFMSSEFMSHGSALFFMSLFILFFARTIKRGRFHNPLIAGASLGIALNGRPMTAFAMCVPFAIYSAILLIKDLRTYVSRFSIMLITVCAFVGILLLFNYLTTGDPMLFGYEAKWGKGHNPGFGHSGWGNPHTPSKGLRQNLNNLNAINKYLFEWPIPCLFFAFLLFATMTRDKWDYLFIGSFWTLSIAYFFYWFQDWCFGPRFMYESSVVMILLTSRGILRTPELVNGVLGLKTPANRVKATVGAAIVICMIIGLSFHIRPLVKLYSKNYWGVNASVLKAVKRDKIENAVVFVRSYYGAVLPANSPTFDGDVIYARDLGMKNRLMMDYYPDRKYYIADGLKIGAVVPPAKDEIIVEAESLKIVDSSGDNAKPQNMKGYGPFWSGDSQILATTNAEGDYVTVAVPVEKDGIHEVSVCYTKADDYGQLQLTVFDGYDRRVLFNGRLGMGKIHLNSGENLFRFQVVGKNQASENFYFGVDCIILRRVLE
ncbi:glycosyltransferase family 39 protein [Candidatus Poribacteria bacterium]